MKRDLERLLKLICSVVIGGWTEESAVHGEKAEKFGWNVYVQIMSRGMGWER